MTLSSEMGGREAILSSRWLILRERRGRMANVSEADERVQLRRECCYRNSTRIPFRHSHRNNHCSPRRPLSRCPACSTTKHRRESRPTDTFRRSRIPYSTCSHFRRPTSSSYLPLLSSPDTASHSSRPAADDTTKRKIDTPSKFRSVHRRLQ